MDIKEEIKKTKKALDKRKKEFPLDVLGRSLSFNPFMPRDIKDYLKPKSNELIQEIKEILSEDLSILKDIQNDDNIKYILVMTNKVDLEYLSTIRRYVNLPIIRYDFIIDSYQILESLVYGADCIVLIAKLLNLEKLKELYNYAIHLGLEVLIEVEDREDLTKAIKCGTNIIGIKYENKNYSDLIPLIPKGKIIIYRR